MASSVASWASMRRRMVLDDASFSHSNGAPSHDSERCRALLLRLVREVLAFVRQHQQRTPSNQHDATSTLWMSAVSRVCEARMQELQGAAGDLLPVGERVKRTTASPREVIAEAMVQELLACVASIRLAETETIVLEEVENVETLRGLRATLKQDEAELRRIVKEGAGEDARLRELQRLLRDEFLQELAQSKAQGLADSLHNEASLQFAWETIQEQKKEIVRLRAENEQLQSDAMRSSEQRGTDGNDGGPRHAIHQLQLQLSSHPDHNLRILQEQVAQLETTLGQHDRRLSRDPATSLSGMTMTSSRDDEDFRRDSILLPSHLATMAPRECEQCRRHTRTLVECQSELKQLRAQCAADENALVQAEKDRLHMKREHAALTSALMASKQKQEELRKMVEEISDEKLRFETLRETQQRNHDRQVDQLQRQLKDLESWRERSGQEKQDHRNVQEALEGELQRMRLRVESLHSERDSARVELSKLKQEIQGVQDDCTVAKAKSVEAETALASADEELRSMKKDLKAARDQITQFQATTSRLRLARDQATATSEAASSGKRDLEQRLDQVAAEASRLQAALRNGEADVTKLERELSKREASISALNKKIHEQRASREAVVRNLQEARTSLQQRQQYVAELEGRLDRSEEERSVQAKRLEELLTEQQQRVNQAAEMKRDLQRQYEECQRLELQLADSQAEAIKFQNRLHESGALVDKLQESADRHKRDRDGVAISSQEQIETLTHELSETKTTILMWMSKYHGVVNAKAEVEEAAKLTNAALDQLRENYRLLAEDKERLLQRADKMTAEMQDLKDERQAVMKELTKLKAQVVVYEGELKRLREEHDRAANNIKVRESDRADHLVEIGVLQADNSVLRREVERVKQYSHDAEAELQAQHARHVEEVEDVQQRHREAIENASITVDGFLAAHDRIVENTLQRLTERLSVFDKRLIVAAEAATEVQAQQMRRQAAARVQLVGSSQITSTQASLSSMHCRQQRSVSTETEESPTIRIEMRAVPTQTTPSNALMNRSTGVPATELTRDAEDPSGSLDIDGLDNAMGRGWRQDWVYSDANDSAASLESLSSRHVAPTRVHEASSLEDLAHESFNESFTSHGDGVAMFQSQIGLHDASFGECDAARDERSATKSSVTTSSVANHVSTVYPEDTVVPAAMIRSTPVIHAQETARFSRFDGEQSSSSITMPEPSMMERYVTVKTALLEVKNDSTRGDYSEENRDQLSQAGSNPSIPSQHPSRSPLSSERLAYPVGIERRQVFGLIVDQFTATEHVLTTQWRLIEALMQKTAERLRVVSDRSARSVATWNEIQRHRVASSRSVASVGCQTSRDPPRETGTGHAPSSTSHDTHTSASIEDAANPEDECDSPETSELSSRAADLGLADASTTKTASIRRASTTRLSQSRVSSHDTKQRRHVTRIHRSVAMLHVKSTPKSTATPTKKLTNPAAIDACVQTIEVDSSTVKQRVADKWNGLASQLLREWTWRGVVTTLHRNQRRLRHRRAVLERFTSLTWKLMARDRARGLLTIVSSQIQAVKATNAGRIEADRSKRVAARWESIVRSAMWRFAARRPLKLVVATLRKRAVKPAGDHAHVQWQLLRWKANSDHHQKTAKRLWLKCMALHRRSELERTLRRHFVAWHGLARGLIHHPSLSQSGNDDDLEATTDDTGLRRPANVSTSLQVVMRECVTLLRQWCHERKMPNEESREPLPVQWPVRSQSVACSSAEEAPSSVTSSTGVMNIELLIRLLLQSSEQIGQWRDAMDKKLEEIRVREAQLSRLQTHCTELQAIIDKYHERHHHKTQVATERHLHEEISVVSHHHNDHQVHTAQQVPQHPAHLRALEEERRRLNQRNIAMLEGVIVQLNEAKESRVWLYQQLQSKTKQLERARRQLEQAHVHSALLRAFYQWRHHTYEHRAN